jgi:hypothetical protein
MGKVIDFNKTVYELSKEFPDILKILKNIGFENIIIPTMLNTVGRVMTIPKGARMRSIKLEEIKNVLISEGFEIINEG